MVPQPQGSSPLAATVLGTIGTVLWCIQLIPQIWQNWRTKNTEGLPISMMVLWSIGGPPLGVYCVVQNFNIPVQVQPQIFTALTLVINAQILIYYHKWSTGRAVAVMGGFAAFLGGFEVLMILALRIAYRRGIQSPTIAMGAITVALLILGFVPLYLDMARRQGRVIGVNFVFLALDSAGAIFSLASLAMQDQFDILGGFSYISILLAESVVFVSHFIWSVRSRGKRSLGSENDSAAAATTEIIVHDENNPRSRETGDVPMEPAVAEVAIVEKGEVASAEDKQQRPPVVTVLSYGSIDNV